MYSISYTLYIAPFYPLYSSSLPPLMSQTAPPTLILPLISTGNIPQLATDLILHSLADEFRFVRSIDSIYLHPFIGPLDHTIDQDIPVLYSDVLPAKSYSTALELFYNESRNLFVLQQRTPVINGYLNNFILETLIPLLKELKIVNLTVLGSFGVLETEAVSLRRKHAENSSFINSQQQQQDPFYSLGICKLQAITDLTENFDKVLNLETDPDTSRRYTSSIFKFTDSSLIQEISTEDQIFKLMYHILNSTTGSELGLHDLDTVKYCCTFVHEGDNSYDAKVFCTHFSDFANCEDGSLYRIQDMKSPVSWKGAYGFSEVPTTLNEGLYI